MKSNIFFKTTGKMKVLMLLSLVVLLSSCSMTQHRARKVTSENLEKAPYDVIIVPGVPFNGQEWSRTMEARVKWSKYLYDNGHAKNIIYSGSAVYTEYNECSIMGLYAQKLGIPKEHVFYDTRAEHSTENVYYSYQIAKANKFEKIALATDPFQSKSLKRFMKKFDFPIAMLPMVFDSIQNIGVINVKIDPTSAKVESFTSIKERETFLKRLKGTFGQNIRWQEEDLKTKHLRKKYADRIE